MILYLSLTDRLFLQQDTTGNFNTTFETPVFFENDIVDFQLQLLQINTGSVINAYSVVSQSISTTTMSVAIGCPHPTNPVVVDSKELGYDPINSLWTGSLNLSNPIIQDVMTQNSSSFIEIQESSAFPTPYILTHIQTPIYLYSDITKS